MLGNSGIPGRFCASVRTSIAEKSGPFPQRRSAGPEGCKLMVAGPKKHHFIPQSVLRRFSVDGDGKKIYVFDKLNDRCWTSAITDAGSENHFNSLEFQGVRI